MTELGPEVFLAFANHSLRENPKGLFKIIKAIPEDAVRFRTDLSEERLPVWWGPYRPNPDPADWKQILKSIAGQIIEFGSDIEAAKEKLSWYRTAGPMRQVPMGNPQTDLDKYAKEAGREDYYRLIKLDGSMRSDFIEVSFEAAFGPWKGSCKTDKNGTDFCFLRMDLNEESLIQTDRQRKCYECFQALFMALLDKIIKGDKYSDVMVFFTFLDLVNSWVSYEYKFDEDKDGTFSELLTKTPIWESIPDRSNERYSRQSRGNYELHPNLFNEFIASIAAVSLFDFLEKHDRRSLKRCQHCGDFFIAKHTKRKTGCYKPECIRAYERSKKEKLKLKAPEAVTSFRKSSCSSYKKCLDLAARKDTALNCAKCQDPISAHIPA